MNVLRTNLDIATESAKTSASQRQEEVALLMAEIDDKDRLVRSKHPLPSLYFFQKHGPSISTFSPRARRVET